MFLLISSHLVICERGELYHPNKCKKLLDMCQHVEIVNDPFKNTPKCLNLVHRVTTYSRVQAFLRKPIVHWWKFPQVLGCWPVCLILSDIEGLECYSNFLQISINNWLMHEKLPYTNIAWKMVLKVMIKTITKNHFIAGRDLKTPPPCCKGWHMKYLFSIDYKFAKQTVFFIILVLW